MFVIGTKAEDKGDPIVYDKLRIPGPRTSRSREISGEPEPEV
jgi:hypothetical protein